MKTLTVRLPETLVAEIDAEAQERKVSKSDVVRERLQAGARHERRPTALLNSVSPDPVVMTTDADFRIYRRQGRRVIPCVTPS